ncbi:MAG: hypothetical protein ACHQNA_01100 [Acidimicrobiales bacterium]
MPEANDNHYDSRSISAVRSRRSASPELATEAGTRPRDASQGSTPVAVGNLLTGTGMDETPRSAGCDAWFQAAG